MGAFDLLADFQGVRCPPGAAGRARDAAGAATAGPLMMVETGHAGANTRTGVQISTR